MRNALVHFILIFVFGISAFAQSEQKLIRRGNRAYSQNDFLESEVQYRQALEKNKYSFKANFNLGNALYKQNKFNEADSIYYDINTPGLSDAEKSMVYFNRGNSLFKQNKFKESADAYKMALKYNPSDMDAKYNLSEALRMMQNQQNQKNNQQQSNNNDNKGNKDQNKNDDKKEDTKDNNKDNKDNQNDKQNNQNKNQQQQPKVSKEDAERMLQALMQREKEIQDKLNKKQAKPVSGASIKNW